ncbi:MAG: stage II sporulation protein P [Peptococcaceae bacterium]|nr:stage II sporulation protein P [Peptococcaceae bacterium]
MFHYEAIGTRKLYIRTRKAAWLKGLWSVLLIVCGCIGMMYVLNQGMAGQFVRVLSEQEVPFETILLEGAPGLSAAQRERLDHSRQQGVALTLFLLTGVNIADERTFFLSYFSPPPEGPVWLGWAYNSKDPEHEGEITDLSAEELQHAQPGQPEQQQPDAQGLSQPEQTAPDPGKVVVGIYHTHNAESYAGGGGSERKVGNGDIVAVGKTLKESLQTQGIGTVQSLAIHDATDFMKAYSASLKTAAQLQQDYPSIRLLLDLHRDGLPAGVKKSTAPVSGNTAARIMVVIGQKNPQWSKNEALAQELIALGEKKYPGLFNANISYAGDARYNQHLMEGALLLEFGSQLNTWDEAEAAARACAEIIADWLKAHP